ncbi:MAG: tyrosine-type recombinase/integrase, partial [Anaerolineae bacterium]|nr:tyrosine-type recombinase/integrase [Anaerolineae bacterium]
MFLRNLIDGFMLDCKARKLSPYTQKAYATTLKEFSDFIGNPQADNITIFDLRKYITYVSERNCYGWGNNPYSQEQDKKLSVWAIHRQARTLKTFFTWAYTEGILSENPSARLRRPKLPQGRIETFSQDEINILLEKAQEQSYRDYAICFTFLDSGLRKSELLNLTLNDVNILTGVIVVQHGKGDKSREVKVGNTCRKILWRYVNDFRPETEAKQFFLAHGGQFLKYHALNSVMRRLSEKCGFRVYCHKFRHTYATNIAKKFPNAFLIS